MGAQKYEISLLVFNSISHCRVEHEKSNHVLFCLLDKHLVDVPVKSTLQHLPPHPRHLTPFPARGGGNLIVRLDFMLSVLLIPRGLINHGGDKLS